MNKFYLKLTVLFILFCSNVSAQDTVAVNSSTQYQTIEGWGHGGGVLGFLGGAEYMLDSSVSKPVNFQTLDFVTSELGLTGSRTWEVGPRIDGTGIDSAGNCDVIDWSKFQSNTLSWQDAQYLIYFQNKVISQGYQPSFYSSPGYPTHATDQKPWIMYHPGERALQLWSSALYLKNTYGININYAVMYNEPASPITSAILSDDIKACGPRFASHGLTTMAQFAEGVAPLNDWNLITPVDSDATLWPFVGRLSYHNYGTADPYRSQIRDFGLFKGIRTGQTEMGSPGFDDLYSDLTLGGVSYWEVAYSGNNTLVPSNGLTSFTPSSYYIRLRQVMHYVRPGAIRIGTTANDGLLKVLSFDQGGAITTVIDNTNAGARTVFISGLPPGTYGLSAAAPGVTTFQEYGLQTVGVAGTLTVTANGGSSITTLYPRSLANMPPTIMTWGTSPGYLVAPVTVATITATASDPEATALTYLWTVASNPAGSTPVIASPTALTTSVTGLTVPGTYVFNIAVSDGVNVSTKKAYLCVYSTNPQPVMGSAGFRIGAPYGLVFGNPGDTTHANIELPTSAATLQLGISDLANSSFTGRGTWSLVSQPAGGVAAVGATTYIFVSIRANVTGMTVPGDYVFQVNVTNPGHPDLTARIICTVHPATSAPIISSITPFADTITLPVSTDLITAVTTDPDLGLLRHWWEINSVPAGAYPVFDHQGLPISNVSNLTVPGNYIFTLRAFDDLHMTTRNVTIVVKPGVSAIGGPSSVCTGSTIPLTDSSSGGAWSSSSTIVGTVSPGGIVTGLSAGTTTISYTLGGAMATKIITVNSLPVAGTVTGIMTACAGAVTSLSDATAGGVWSSTATGIATVGSTGIVTGISAGTTTISYTVNNSCATVAATAVVTVNPLPVAGTITGTLSICPTATTSLSDASGGGVWSSGATGVATIGSTGIVTGVANGTSLVSYTVTNGCGTVAATATITVSSVPNAGTITGALTVCPGAVTVLSDAVGGGVWTSTATGIATIGSTGIVTGMAAGTTTISYTVTTLCGTASATMVQTVNPLPNAGVITGASVVCQGATSALVDIAPGGVWSSVTTGVATIGSTGVVTGVAAGTTTISYTVTTLCGTASATMVQTVNPLPNAGVIAGTPVVCLGATTALTDVSPGGVWTSTAPGIATIGGTGMVTGLAAGTTTISYTVASICGTATATTALIVNPLPNAGVITGTPVACVGATTALADVSPGGVWTSTAPGIATIGGTGIVTGVAAGTTTISYTVTTLCGTASATMVLTVNSLTGAGAITGALVVCEGATTALADASPGGVWTSTSPGIATIGSTGIVTGIAAGTATMLYTLATCGTAVATAVITVNPLPNAGVISGTLKICPAGATTLTDPVAAGVWSSVSPAVAVISSTGVVTGVAGGTTMISYTVTDLCGSRAANVAVTVDPLPTPGTITGSAIVCVGMTTTLLATPSGGAWSSKKGKCTVLGGVVTGISPGADSIVYVRINACGYTNAFFPLSVYSASHCDSAAATKIIAGTGATLSVFPNPNQGAFSLLLSSSIDEDVLFTVTNMSGEKAKSFSAKTNKITDLSLNLATGVYFVSAFTSGGGFYYSKMVVVK